MGGFRRLAALCPSLLTCALLLTSSHTKALSSLAVLIAAAGGCSGHSCEPSLGGSPSAAFVLLAALNTVPVVAAVVVTRWVSTSDNCPASPFDGAPANASVSCGGVAVGLDVVGVVSARLARFNLGVSLLLATRGDSAWLRRATGGWIGLPEVVALHRTAGWWCVGQAALHSTAYFAFYPLTGGLRSLWLNCFPAALPVAGTPAANSTAAAANSTAAAAGNLNRLGLVNFFGVVACAAMLVVVVPALPYLRRRGYHIFQRLHLPASLLFVACCALHDLPILLFAVPGLADWFVGWRSTRQGPKSKCPCALASSAAPATARQLAGTSGPWIKLTVDCSGASMAQLMAVAGAPGERRPLAPRGEWALVRVLPLGRETHPLSVAVSPRGAGFSALVTASAGDWSTQLAALAGAGTGCRCEVEVAGPFLAGGGDWSLATEPALLLLAGGTGVWGWLPALTAADAGAGRMVHLVWCVSFNLNPVG